MPGKNEIDVSIIIPLYNAARTLARTLHSTQNQGVTVETILINDCSQDDSSLVAASLQKQYSDISLIELEKNVGAAAARNVGIQHARGKYIAFLDADDVWLPGKLRTQIAAFEADPQCTLVSCDTLQITPRGEVLRRGHSVKPPVSGADAWKTLLRYNFIPTPTVLTRSELVQSVGGFDESLVVSEDLDLWISLARKGNVVVLPQVFVHYFDYSNSLMKRGIIDSFTNTQRMIENHIREECRLSKEEIRNILSIRHYGIAMDALQSGENKEASKFFSLAIANGHPAWKIRVRLLKRSIKNRIIHLFRR
jgi:glycosyltransferase involved in cell wall biosynthesis